MNKLDHAILQEINRVCGIRPASFPHGNRVKHHYYWNSAINTPPQPENCMHEQQNKERENYVGKIVKFSPEPDSFEYFCVEQRQNYVDLIVIPDGRGFIHNLSIRHDNQGVVGLWARIISAEVDDERMDKLIDKDLASKDAHANNLTAICIAISQRRVRDLRLSRDEAVEDLFDALDENRRLLGQLKAAEGDRDIAKQRLAAADGNFRQMLAANNTGCEIRIQGVRNQNAELQSQLTGAQVERNRAIERRMAAERERNDARIEGSRVQQINDSLRAENQFLTDGNEKQAHIIRDLRARAARFEFAPPGSFDFIWPIKAS